MASSKASCVLRVALLQLKVTKDKAENVRHAVNRIREAVTQNNSV